MANSSNSKRLSLGLKVCVNPKDALVDILFVHGLTGNRESTWTDTESNIFWPAAFLEKDIPQARILNFGYDADFAHFLALTSVNRIGEHANNLANELAQLRVETDSVERPLLFVAHSLGGLVVKDAILAAKDNSEKYIRELVLHARGIVFLGTPHLGTDKAKWASLLANFASVFEKGNDALPGVLKPDSQVLARINSEFHQMVSIRLQESQPPIWIKCFYEEYPYKGVVVVSQQSASLLGYNPQGINANHVEMCKFSSRDDSGYKAIKFQLVLWLNEIMAEVLQPQDSSRILNRGGQNGDEKRSFLGQYTTGNTSVSVGSITSGENTYFQVNK